MTQAGVYTIAQVEAMTGFSAEVLRQWERRYGFPKPERTPGGHRLYRPEELEALLVIRRWLEEGASPQAAIRRYLAQESRPEGLPQELLTALLDADLPRAEALFRRGVKLLGPEGALRGLLVPVLKEVGDRWHRGEVNVAQEHLATQFLRSRLQELFGPGGLSPGCAPFWSPHLLGSGTNLGLCWWPTTSGGAAFPPCIWGPILPFLTSRVWRKSLGRGRWCFRAFFQKT